MHSQTMSPPNTSSAIESSSVGRRALGLLSATILSLSLGACAPVWVKTEASNVSAAGEGPQGKSSFKAPLGWLRIITPVTGVVLMSKDGEGVQQMRVAQNRPDQVFPTSKIKIASTALPEDIANAFQAEIKTGLGGGDVTSKSMTPLTLAGLPGFRTHFSYRDQRGTPREMVVAGAKRGDEIIYVAYQALSIHYFQRDVALFDQTVASLKLK